MCSSYTMTVVPHPRRVLVPIVMPSWLNSRLNPGTGYCNVLGEEIRGQTCRNGFRPVMQSRSSANFPHRHPKIFVASRVATFRLCSSSTSSSPSYNSTSLINQPHFKCGLRLLLAYHYQDATTMPRKIRAESKLTHTGRRQHMPVYLSSTRTAECVAKE